MPALVQAVSKKSHVVCAGDVQVDLRGFLGERSWLRPILDALGWVDAYVERMLMAVILVKDEVGCTVYNDHLPPTPSTDCVLCCHSPVS